MRGLPGAFNNSKHSLTSQVCVEVKSIDLVVMKYLICVCSRKCFDSLAKRSLYLIWVEQGVDKSQDNLQILELNQKQRQRMQVGEHVT